MQKILRYSLWWLPLPVIAIINGTIRVLFFQGLYEPSAHQLSSYMLIFFISAYAWIIFPKMKFEWELDTAAAGLVWVTLTLLFEFVGGHYLFGAPWSKLLHDYNLFEGRLFLVIVIWTGVINHIIHRLKYP